MHLNWESRAGSFCAQVYTYKDFVQGNQTECWCSKLPINFFLNWDFHVSGPVALLSRVRVASLLAW